MEFVNNFKGIKKVAKDMYHDFFYAWAEYTYISTTIRSQILEIVEQDDDFSQNKDSDCSVIITDQIIKVYIYPYVSLKTVKELEKLLGVNCCIKPKGQKKTAKIVLIFSNDEDPFEDEK